MDRLCVPIPGHNGSYLIIPGPWTVRIPPYQTTMTVPRPITAHIRQTYRQSVISLYYPIPGPWTVHIPPYQTTMTVRRPITVHIRQTYRQSVLPHTRPTDCPYSPIPDHHEGSFNNKDDDFLVFPIPSSGHM